MSILFISILFNLMLQFNGGVGVYFFKNVIGKEELVAPFLSTYSLFQIAGIFCYPIMARFMKRTWIIGISSICAVITCMMILLLPDFNYVTAAHCLPTKGVQKRVRAEKCLRVFFFCPGVF